MTGTSPLSLFGYQYGEIAGSLASVYFCGGDCVEDVTSHLCQPWGQILGMGACPHDAPVVRAVRL